MKIETRKLSIRAAKPSDDVDILRAAKCPQISLMYSNNFTSIKSVQQYIEVLNDEYKLGNYKTMAIADKLTNILIGLITLEPDKSFPRAEVSYWIASLHRNNGYATEAVSAIIDYGFNKLSLNRIQAMHFPDNVSSARVLEKAGMSYEGTLRQYVGMGEMHLDCLMYAILKKDFSTGRENRPVDFIN